MGPREAAASLEAAGSWRGQRVCPGVAGGRSPALRYLTRSAATLHAWRRPARLLAPPRPSCPRPFARRRCSRQLLRGVEASPGQLRGSSHLALLSRVGAAGVGAAGAGGAGASRLSAAGPGGKGGGERQGPWQAHARACCFPALSAAGAASCRGLLTATAGAQVCRHSPSHAAAGPACGRSTRAAGRAAHRSRPSLCSLLPLLPLPELLSRPLSFRCRLLPDLQARAPAASPLSQRAGVNTQARANAQQQPPRVRSPQEGHHGPSSGEQATTRNHPPTPPPAQPPTPAPASAPGHAWHMGMRAARQPPAAARTCARRPSGPSCCACASSPCPCPSPSPCLCPSWGHPPHQRRTRPVGGRRATAAVRQSCMPARAALQGWQAALAPALGRVR
jgi:hypothetical protein